MDTLQDKINALETPAKMYLQNLYDALADAIVIRNDALPDEYQQTNQFENGGVVGCGKFYGRTIAEIEKIAERKRKANAPSQSQIDKEQRALRVELYREQYENEGQPKDFELDMIEDDDRLYRAQVAFANLVGIEFED
jgi:hypothetical protein